MTENTDTTETETTPAPTPEPERPNPVLNVAKSAFKGTRSGAGFALRLYAIVMVPFVALCCIFIVLGAGFYLLTTLPALIVVAGYAIAFVRARVHTGVTFPAWRDAHLAVVRAHRTAFGVAAGLAVVPALALAVGTFINEGWSIYLLTIYILGGGALGLAAGHLSAMGRYSATGLPQFEEGEYAPRPALADGLSGFLRSSAPWFIASVTLGVLSFFSVQWYAVDHERLVDGTAVYDALAIGVSLVGVLAVLLVGAFIRGIRRAGAIWALFWVGVWYLAQGGDTSGGGYYLLGWFFMCAFVLGSLLTAYVGALIAERRMARVPEIEEDPA